MIKIFNIVLGDISTGELGIAISFIRNQKSGYYANYLLIPEEKKVIVEENEFNLYELSKSDSPCVNQRKVEILIQELSPDLIILFDAFTFEYAQSWTGCNMKFLKKFKIPLASIDEYEYTRTNLKVDYYGIFVKKLPPLLNECDYVFKNCPLSMPKEDETVEIKNLKQYYYRVFPEMEKISDKVRDCYREKYFNVKDSKKKVVFFVTSYWEVYGAYSFSCQNQLAKWLGPMVYGYLRDLDSDIVLFHVGVENWRLSSSDKLTYIHCNSLATLQYEKVMQASDLFLTYNAVSISLSKAVLFGVPAIVLNNQKIIDFEKLKNPLKERPKWYQDMAADIKKVYPFSASLFGWNNFLQVCFEDNQYLSSFDIINTFNYKKTLEMLRKVLFDAEYRESVAKRESIFEKEYYAIKSSEEILNDVFRQ